MLLPILYSDPTYNTSLTLLTPTAVEPNSPVSEFQILSVWSLTAVMTHLSLESHDTIDTFSFCLPSSSSSGALQHQAEWHDSVIQYVNIPHYTVSLTYSLKFSAFIVLQTRIDNLLVQCDSQPQHNSGVRSHSVRLPFHNWTCDL